MNSWENSDSEYGCDDRGGTFCTFECGPECTAWRYKLGNNDLSLMKKLVSAGSDHGKFLRMINVTLDITAPLYWWKEFDTYKVGTVANSCSTMHKIAAKEFVIDDFSYDHLITNWIGDNCEAFIYPKPDEPYSPMNVLGFVIDALNVNREAYLKTKDKKYWWQMIQLLPSSYNQKRTVQLNYQVLRNIYFARRNHKLDEWRSFCDMMCKLPYAEIITIENGE